MAKSETLCVLTPSRDLQVWDTLGSGWEGKPDAQVNLKSALSLREVPALFWKQLFLTSQALGLTPLFSCPHLKGSSTPSSSSLFRLFSVRCNLHKGKHPFPRAVHLPALCRVQRCRPLPQDAEHSGRSRKPPAPSFPHTTWARAPTRCPLRARPRAEQWPSGAQSQGHPGLALTERLL